MKIVDDRSSDPQKPSFIVLYGISFLVSPIVLFFVSSFFNNGPVSTSTVLFSITILPAVFAAFFNYVIILLNSHQPKNKKDKRKNTIEQNSLQSSTLPVVQLIGGIIMCVVLMVLAAFNVKLSYTKEIVGTFAGYHETDLTCSSDTTFSSRVDNNGRCYDRSPIFSYLDLNNQVQYYVDFPTYDDSYKQGDTKVLHLSDDNTLMSLVGEVLLLPLYFLVPIVPLLVMYALYRFKFFKRRK